MFMFALYLYVWCNMMSLSDQMKPSVYHRFGNQTFFIRFLRFSNYDFHDYFTVYIYIYNMFKDVKCNTEFKTNRVNITYM